MKFSKILLIPTFTLLSYTNSNQFFSGDNDIRHSLYTDNLAINRISSSQFGVPLPTIEATDK